MRKIALAAAVIGLFTVQAPVTIQALAQTPPPTSKDAVRADRDKVKASEAELQKLITPHLDRDFKRLSPVERAILYIGAFELASHPETPFKVVLNEAVELGKSFGATDGHRFVNGVLEKIAIALRPEEVARTRTNA